MGLIVFYVLSILTETMGDALKYISPTIAYIIVGCSEASTSVDGHKLVELSGDSVAKFSEGDGASKLLTGKGVDRIGDGVRVAEGSVVVGAISAVRPRLIPHSDESLCIAELLSML